MNTRRPSRLWFAFVVSAIVMGCASVSAQTNLLLNPGFENSGKPLDGWTDIWNRDPGAATAILDTTIQHSGQASLKVVSTALRDWSVGQRAKVSVKEGEIYDIRGWLKCEGESSVQLSVVTSDSTGATLDWTAGMVETSGTHDWQQFTSRIVVPHSCVGLQYRLTGSGPGTVWLDDTELVKIGDITDLQAKWKSKTFTLDNSILHVVFNPLTATFDVRDKRTGRSWHQYSPTENALVESVRPEGTTSELMIELDAACLTEPLTMVLSLPKDSAQLRVTLSSAGQMNGQLAYPAPMETTDAENLVVPMNEGMLFPTGDKAVQTRTLATYNGHGGLSMPWAGVCASDGSGIMLLIRTPDDAEVDLVRTAVGNLTEAPAWVASRDAFAYPRKLTYVFIEKGGYVAQAKWYRAYAKSTGLFKTLAEKRKENPNVDLLVGSVDVWSWEGDAAALCHEMKSLGMDHVLWSSAEPADQVSAINKLGYLTGKYDQYQDAYPPGTPGATLNVDWPDDLEYDKSGTPINGWLETITQPDGSSKQYQAGVCNAKRALDFATMLIPPDLKSTPYKARFLDTDTASPWREDYNPHHPMSRTDDRRYRLGLLQYCSRDLKLVTGSETGIDPAVPYLDYFEGMMSISEYRPPNDGYNVDQIIEPTPDILKYQVGPEYRIPLFELVYHDCTVDYWYWGDYNNKVPAVWPKRDLFNILYGTPPVFMFNRDFWAKNKTHFVASYHNICPLARKLAYSEMLSHNFLTSNHTVQSTTWSSGETVIVNFGDTQFSVAPGTSIKPMSWLVKG